MISCQNSLNRNAHLRSVTALNVNCTIKVTGRVLIYECQEGNIAHRIFWTNLSLVGRNSPSAWTESIWPCGDRSHRIPCASCPRSHQEAEAGRGGSRPCQLLPTCFPPTYSYSFYLRGPQGVHEGTRLEQPRAIEKNFLAWQELPLLGQDPLMLSLWWPISSVLFRPPRLLTDSAHSLNPVKPGNRGQTRCSFWGLL